MTHREKVRFMLEDLKKRGMDPWDAAPPLFRLLARVGIALDPPFFQSWNRLFLAHLPAYLVAITGTNWLLGSGPWARSPVDDPWVGTVVASLLVAACSATRIRVKADALSLPPWPEYGFREHAPEAFS